MSNQAKAQSRKARIKKASNMRKNNGVGRTTERQAIHDAADAKQGIGSRISSGLKNLMGK